MDLQPLTIIGAGGFGREVLDVVEAINAQSPRYRFLGFLDAGTPDEESLQRRDAKVIGTPEDLAHLEADYVIGIGNGATRRAIDEQAMVYNRRAATLIHPAATLGGDVRIADGVIITAGVRMTTNITLGRHVHLNLQVTVGHDCVLEDYVTVNPGVSISGECTLENEVTMGTGSVIIQQRRVGARSIVGAGAVVVRDLAPDVTAVGMPAKPISR